MKLIFGLVFVVLVALCTFLTQPIYRARMEEDLLSKTRAILDEEGLGRINAAVVRHELRLTPLADAQPSELARAIELSDKVWGAYLPDTPNVDEPPVLRGASLVGTEKLDGVLVLQGEMPNEALRSQLVDAAEAIPGVSQVDDQLVVASDIAQPVWGNDVSGLLQNIVTTADSANLSISDDDFRISGLVGSDESKAELGSLAESVPHGEASLVNGLTFEPWTEPTFRLQRSGKRLILTGVLPDEETRKVMVEQAKVAAGNGEVIDRTTLANRTRAPWWGSHSSGFLLKFFGESKGPAFVSYTSTQIEAESIVPTPKSKSELASLAARGLPTEIERAVKITVVEKKKPAPIAKVEPTPAPVPTPAPTPPVPKANYGEFKQLAVYFNTASSYVQSKEVAKIERAAALIKGADFAGTNLTVGGYADLRGNAESNRVLSLERANAVRKKLIELGVPADRLSVEFFGEDTSKVASADLWRSRRVEISVKKQ